MSLPDGRIHLVGAGGSGMSAIAKLLVGRGQPLSGSDLRGGASVEALADLDVPVLIGHHPEAISRRGIWWSPHRPCPTTTRRSRPPGRWAYRCGVGPSSSKP